MRALIADDNVVNRLVLKEMLATHAVCDEVDDGMAALGAVERAWSEGRPYDLLCLDIMMPALDGQEVLREVRRREQDRGIPEHRAVKVIMTTALDDRRTILDAFRNQCEAYLVKPVTRQLLVDNLKKMGLATDAPSLR